ncbi:hypothetical protein GGR51DRAFT_578183 [Nemania sp. FL0031]|nr:hypothetical protein GGR51DRAFT_578183 [Nemania sp. FL0031]
MASSNSTAVSDRMDFSYSERADMIDPMKDPKADSQDSSPFFRLKRKIRDEIYRYTFLMTRLTYDERYDPFNDNHHTRITPNKHSLALLETCKQIRLDISDSWLQYVLFNFGNCTKMAKMLNSWSYYIISQIRYLRVCSVFIIERPRLRTPVHALELNDSLPRLLTKFEGLQLDRLTVLAGDESLGSYFAIESLIANGNGWRELEYICRDSGILMLRDPERARDRTSLWNAMVISRDTAVKWQRLLELRDGVATQSSVTLYQTDTPYWINQVWRRVVPDLDHHHHQLRVVVKRGAGINYQQLRTPPQNSLMPRYVREDIYIHRDEYDWSFWNDRFLSPYADDDPRKPL